MIIKWEACNLRSISKLNIKETIGDTYSLFSNIQIVAASNVSWHDEADKHLYIQVFSDHIIRTLKVEQEYKISCMN